MGRKNNFLLVDLADSATKDLAETISSTTSRKILDYLANVENVSESEIAKKCGIAISTVHYHLQKLVAAKLVEIEGFTYSKKGREVNHYKLANKYIIIAPKKVTGLASKLRGILPALGITAGVAFVVDFVRKFGSFTASTFAMESVVTTSSSDESPSLDYAREAGESLEMELADSAAEEIANEVLVESADAVAQVASSGSFVDVFWWIVLGAVVGLVASAFWKWAVEKWKERR